MLLRDGVKGDRKPIRHRLLDLTFNLRRGAVYAILTLMVVSAYLTIASIGLLISGTQSTVAIFGAGTIGAVITALLAYRFGERLYRLVDRFLYSETYDYHQKLHDITRRTSSILNLQELKQLFWDTIIRIKEPSKAALYFIWEDDASYRIEFAQGIDLNILDENWTIEAQSPLVHQLKQSKNLLLRRNEVETLQYKYLFGPWDAELHQLDELETCLILALKYSDKLVGFLVLGPRINQRPYREEDLFLLESICPDIAIALENARLYSRAQQMAIIDSLTEIYNHRYFYKRLKEEITRAQRLGLPLTLIMIDIDAFHVYNDIHGHARGDKALQETATILRQCARRTDLVFRYGGEEFALLVPGMADSQVYPLAERMRKAMENHGFPSLEGSSGLLTISIGIASYPNSVDTSEGLLFCADMALLRAKRLGRNNTQIWEPLGEGEEKEKAMTATKIAETAYLSTVYALASTVDAKDLFTYGHSEKVARYAVALGEEAGLNGESLIWLRMAALLHDIGKIGISDDALNKQGRLSRKEIDEIKKHPKLAETILGNIPAFTPLMPAIIHHHERYDGNGYPSGLNGKEIPLEARIICIADAYDAITSERSYRSLLSHEQAIDELRKGRESQFDPWLVDLFCQIKGQIKNGALAR